MYGRTNKKDISQGIARQEQREAFFASKAGTSAGISDSGSVDSSLAADMLVYEHHHMSHSVHHPRNIYAIARDLSDDPAVDVSRVLDTSEPFLTLILANGRASFQNCRITF